MESSYIEFTIVPVHQGTLFRLRGKYTWFISPIVNLYHRPQLRGILNFGLCRSNLAHSLFYIIHRKWLCLAEKTV